MMMTDPNDPAQNDPGLVGHLHRAMFKGELVDILPGSVFTGSKLILGKDTARMPNAVSGYIGETKDRGSKPGTSTLNIPVRSDFGYRGAMVTRRFYRTVQVDNDLWIEEADGCHGPWVKAGGYEMNRGS